jgi:hypothetical protein
VSRTGSVSSSSSVPLRRSSAHRFIVTAGTKNMRIAGIHWLSVARSARLRPKNVSVRNAAAAEATMNSVRNT